MAMIDGMRSGGRGRWRKPATAVGLLAAAALSWGGCGESPTAAKVAAPEPQEGVPVLVSQTWEANPVVSPDGAWVLFESDMSGDMEIYRMPASGGEAERLTRHPAFDSSPDWSPDGRWIVFESDRDGRKHLWALAADSPQQDPIALTSGPWEDGSPAWSPRGDRIVFESNRDKSPGTDLYTVVFAGGRVDRLTVTPDATYCRTADWSPQGDLLVYESNASGYSALFVVPAEGGKGSQITPDDHYEGHPAWSPDGGWIAFESTRDGPSQIYLVAPAGGPWTQVTFRGGFWPQWTPRGDALVYCVNAGGGADVLRLELN